MSQVNCGKSCVFGSFLIEWITVFNKFYFHRAGKLATQLTLGKILWLLIDLQYLLCTQNNTALLIVLSLGDWRCFRNCLWNNRHGLSFLSIYKIHFLKHFFLVSNSLYIIALYKIISCERRWTCDWAVCVEVLFRELMFCLSLWSL